MTVKFLQSLPHRGAPRAGIASIEERIRAARVNSFGGSHLRPSLAQIVGVYYTWGVPAKDVIHEVVKTALVNDGWTITHDPFPIRLEPMRVFADLGAERPIAAEKAGRKIAVEIKSFTGLSVMDDLEKAVGQYGVYSALLAEIEPDRTIYLAVSEAVFANVLDTLPGRILTKRLALKIIVVALGVQEVVQWID